MNKCPVCGTILVSHETAHAFDGKLFCSRVCAIKHYVENCDTYKYGLISHDKATECAKLAYDARAEIVSTQDVLAEDLQIVQISVTCFKTITLPKCMSEEKALEVAEKLWNDGVVVAEIDDCDEVVFECMLVKDDYNSKHKED